MSIMDCVTRQIFSVLSTIVIDESENRSSAGGLEHDIEIPRPSTLADISAEELGESVKPSLQRQTT